MDSPDLFKQYPFNVHSYLTRGIIWTQRKLYGYRTGRFLKPVGLVPSDFPSANESNAYISGLIDSGSPCMVTRFGCVEKDCFERWFDRHTHKNLLQKSFGIILGENGPWWYDNSNRQKMFISAGFFPPTDEMFDRFGERVESDAKLIDLHASWYPGEARIKPRLFPNAKTCTLDQLDPFFANQPWTKKLAGKKVLVIHPFVESIKRQYAHRNELFNDPEFLPEFELKTIRAIVSHCDMGTPFHDWFEALKHMEDQITATDFDVAIIGCGAYGFSLAATIKRMGKQALHLGGVTQLLFGIMGRRWETSPNRIRDELFRPSWCRPDISETPKRIDLMENGCYW